MSQRRKPKTMDRFTPELVVTHPHFFCKAGAWISACSQDTLHQDARHSPGTAHTLQVFKPSLGHGQQGCSGVKGSTRIQNLHVFASASGQQASGIDNDLVAPLSAKTEPTPLSPSLMGMSNCVGLRCPGRRALALQLHLSHDRTNHIKQLKACKTCPVELQRLPRMRWNAAKIPKTSLSFPLQHCKSALLGRVVAAHAGLPQGSGLKPPKLP